MSKMGNENETIRWPTNLDRAAIERRLAKVAESARAIELHEVCDRFTNVQAMSAAQIATNVVACLTWISNQPEHQRATYESITRELEMVALNLKNLK
jgi:hypothetical protein